MHPAESPTPRRWLLRIVFTLLALLALYVLSVGPVHGYLLHRITRTRMSTQEHVLIERVQAFYRPIILSAAKTPLEPPLSIYIGWWERLYNRLSGTHSPFPE
jgi:hypothetical protein